MKKTKRFLAAVMALAMVSAFAPMSAVADSNTVVDNKNNLPPQDANFKVKYTYDVHDPTYMITIPAGVDLLDSKGVEETITAEEVANMVVNNKKIVVTLESASNNETGDSIFKAKNGDSVATYTITAGTAAVRVGDTIAEFTENGSAKLSFSKINLPVFPVAGDYTETLTFGIAAKEYWTEVDLSKLTGDYVAQDGEMLTGTLAGNYKISIADGANIILNDVTINGVNDEAYKWAGITALGDATITLKGNNTVKGFDANYPGIYVPENKTLTINGVGGLNVSANGIGAAIGAGQVINCGNIIIEGGEITATGGTGGAGIGGSNYGNCGDITITGGNITATSKFYGAGIGSGDASACGNITITGGDITATSRQSGAGIGGAENGGSYNSITITGGNITATGGAGGAGIGCALGSGSSAHTSNGDITIEGGIITATGGEDYTAGIGSASYSDCGNITINGGKVTATGGFMSAGIGCGGRESACGNITINGGEVTATGGYYSAGIGCVGTLESICGNITIANTVTKVTATKGEDTPNSIGAGLYSTCGTVTVGGVEGAITASPYTYKPKS